MCAMSRDERDFESLVKKKSEKFPDFFLNGFLLKEHVSKRVCERRQGISY